MAKGKGKATRPTFINLEDVAARRVKIEKEPNQAKKTQMQVELDKMILTANTERFKFYATLRMNKAINSLRQIGALSGQGYHSTEEQRNKMREVLQEALDKALDKLGAVKGEKKKDQFQF